MHGLHLPKIFGKHLLPLESLQQLLQPTYRGLFSPVNSFWTVLDPIKTPIPK
jgi:hypothetical protein